MKSYSLITQNNKIYWTHTLYNLEKRRKKLNQKTQINRSMNTWKTVLHGLLNLVWQCSIPRDHDSSIIQQLRDTNPLNGSQTFRKKCRCPSDTVCFDRSLFHLQLDRAIFPLLSSPRSSTGHLTFPSSFHRRTYMYMPLRSDWN